LQIIAGDHLTGFWTNWKRALGSMSPSALEKKIPKTPKPQNPYI